MLRTAPLLLLLALSAGCASVSVSPVSSAQQSGAARMAAAGDHLQAARAWAAAAADSRGAARDHAWLMSAEQYLLAGDPSAARQAFAQVTPRRLSGSDLARHDLLAAGFLADDGAHDQALARLSAPASTVPADLRTRWHTLRADLLERSGRRFDAAAELALMLETLDRGDRAAMIRRIDKLLGETSDPMLSQGSASLPPGHPLYPYAGRALVRRGLPLPRPLERGGSMAGLDGLPPAESDGYRPPQKLGVLLPLSGPLAAAGRSVRDGMLAGFYGESRRRPQISFYDTHGNAAGARSARDQAMAEGAQMLVGPLMRDEVDALFGAPLDVPTIALNRGAVLPPPGSTTFALSPEDEGAAAADRLADRRLLRVLVVSQNDDGAMRALNAFKSRLAERGGEVVGDARVSESTPDYVPALQQAMAGMRPDALFLALKAAPARLLSSQVETAGLIGVPRVATSLILSGSNLRQDTELDGIEFPELPWLLGLRGGGLPDSDTIGGTLPSAKGGGARLFAFGHDAWKLSGYLDRLLTDPSAMIQGATGELQLDANGAVTRRVSWAVFSGGRPRPALDGALLPTTVTQ